MSNAGDRETEVDIVARNLRRASHLNAELTKQEKADLLSLVENVRSTIVQVPEYRGIEIHRG